MLLDDDPISLAFLQHWLEQHGWRVALASSAAVAEDLLQQHPFDCLLVDRWLPDADGLEWLWKRQAARPIRVWMLSGEQIDSAQLPAGVSFLRKPVDAELLLRQMDAGQTCVAPVSPGACEAPLDDLDDGVALRALGGNAGAVESLRKMLRAQLVSGYGWAAALGDPAARAVSLNEVHKLRAGAAMTGCARVAHVCAQIETGLRAGALPSAQLQAALAESVSTLPVKLPR